MSRKRNRPAESRSAAHPCGGGDKLDITEPEKLARDLNALRTELLADPYFKNVPSMQPERRKTALAFHAKDDLAEVRREVYKLLQQLDLRFYAVIRNKADLVS